MSDLDQTGAPQSEQTLEGAYDAVDRIGARVQGLEQRHAAATGQMSERIDSLGTRVGTAETLLNQTRGWLSDVQRTAERADGWIRQTGEPFVRNFNTGGAAAAQPQAGQQTPPSSFLNQPTQPQQNAAGAANGNNAPSGAQQGVRLVNTDLVARVATVFLLVIVVLVGIKVAKWVWYWGDTPTVEAGRDRDYGGDTRTGDSRPGYTGGEAQPASAGRAIAKVPTTPNCPAGYTWYADIGKCRDMFDEPVFAGKAKCTPGSAQKVPDPAKGPGYTKLQKCGYAPTSTK